MKMLRTLCAICILGVLLAGCSDGRTCPQEFGGGKDGEPTWMGACTARLTFDEENSRLVVSFVSENQTEYWGEFAMESSPRGAHIAFNAPASAQSPELPANLKHIAYGPIEKGQYLSLCGSGEHNIGIRTLRGPLSSGVVPLHLKPCDG
jgi:hypothetical protein